MKITSLVLLAFAAMAPARADDGVVVRGNAGWVSVRQTRRIGCYRPVGFCCSVAATSRSFVHERTRALRPGRGRLCAAARSDRRQQSEALPGRYLVSVFRASAPRGPGALHKGRHVRLVLVGDQVQGHHVGRDGPPELFVRSDAWRHLDHRPADGISPRQLHLDGSAEARRAAQGGVADRGADEPEQAVDARSASVRETSWTRCRATRRSTGCSTCRSS